MNAARSGSPGASGWASTSAAARSAATGPRWASISCRSRPLRCSVSARRRVASAKSTTNPLAAPSAATISAMRQRSWRRPSAVAHRNSARPGASPAAWRSRSCSKACAIGSRASRRSSGRSRPRPGLPAKVCSAASLNNRMRRSAAQAIRPSDRSRSTASRRLCCSLARALASARALACSAWLLRQRSASARIAGTSSPRPWPCGAASGRSARAWSRSWISRARVAAGRSQARSSSSPISAWQPSSSSAASSQGSAAGSALRSASQAPPASSPSVARASPRNRSQRRARADSGDRGRGDMLGSRRTRLSRNPASA